MSRPTLSDLLGLRIDLEEKLAGEEGNQWMDALKKFLRKQNPWEATTVVVKESESLLSYIDEIPAPAIANLAVNKESLLAANVKYYSSDFNNIFFGLIEENVKAKTVKAYALKKRSVDGPIRKELGEAREVTSMAHVLWLIAQQSKGQKGLLLTNSWANIFYVKDGKGNLWAVHARWYSDDGCWNVLASSVADSLPWYADNQVFSRD